MGPIVVTNTLFKVLESRFTEDLNQAFQRLPKLSYSQVGFVRGMTTHVNIVRLLSKITEGCLRGTKQWVIPDNSSTNRNLKIIGLFIDYEQAYNSINLIKLAAKLKEKTSLDHNLIDFIFWTYSKLTFNLGKESYHPKNGVPQGGINSPILFDFAIYFMLEEFVAEYHVSPEESQHTDNKISENNSLFFADDAAYIFRFSTSWIEIKKRLKNFILS